MGRLQYNPDFASNEEGVVNAFNILFLSQTQQKRLAVHSHVKEYRTSRRIFC